MESYGVSANKRPYYGQIKRDIREYAARIKDFLTINSETYDFLKLPYHGHYLKSLDIIPSFSLSFLSGLMKNSPNCLSSDFVMSNIFLLTVSTKPFHE